MEILYICQSADFLNGDFELAAYLTRKTNSVLVGVILESLDWEEVPITESSRLYISTALPENEAVRMRSEDLVKRFQDACVAAEIPNRVHIDRNRPLRELVAESRYADLMIINANLSPDGREKRAPTDFVKKILECATCPVIVTSQHFEKIDRLVFAYDGSLNSIYAIKQFSYLLSDFRDTPIKVVEVISGGQEDITEKHKLHEWLGMHYSDVELIAIEGDSTDDRLLEYLIGVQDALIIMDGYGRGVLSRILSPSISAPVISLVNLPVFITHIPQ